MYVHTKYSFAFVRVVYKNTVGLYSGHMCMCFVRSETCPYGMVRCGPNATRPCTREWELCNGHNDCGDNSDEEDCGELTTAIAVIIITGNHS